MRFSSATVLVIIAVLASSISATPTEADTDKCPWFCTQSADCWECCMAGLVYLHSELYFCFQIDAVWDPEIASDWSC
ncbi:hypothetical protein BD769DRAFT_1458572 [Suillus cothurnatus]|nr:hypothetical protein BD769DRAFT_1458572 [Suillus cothurnatus]